MLIDPPVDGWLLVLVGLALFATQEPRHLVLSLNMATQLLIRILEFFAHQRAHYHQNMLGPIAVERRRSQL